MGLPFRMTFSCRLRVSPAWRTSASGVADSPIHPFNSLLPTRPVALGSPQTPTLVAERRSPLSSLAFSPLLTAYFDGVATMTSDYDWHYNTIAQPELNKTVYWPRGKVVGGSSAVNGLYMIRGSEIEHNSWGSLVNATDLWGWDAIYPYMKSEFGRAALEPPFLASFAYLRERVLTFFVRSQSPRTTPLLSLPTRRLLELLSTSLTMDRTDPFVSSPFSLARLHSLRLS